MAYGAGAGASGPGYIVAGICIPFISILALLLIILILFAAHFIEDALTLRC